MKFNPNRHHRRSIRLPGYDYSQPGSYFVTICTYERQCIFGTIRDQTVSLSRSGEIVDQCWRALSDHFFFVELDAYMIMPNHLHGIIIINDYGQVKSVNSSGTKPKSLASIIQNFKSVSARKIKQAFQAEGTISWQRGYYERIIRGEAEMNNVRQYIMTNPNRWKNRA